LAAFCACAPAEAARAVRLRDVPLDRVLPLERVPPLDRVPPLERVPPLDPVPPLERVLREEVLRGDDPLVERRVPPLRDDEPEPELEPLLRA